MDRTVPDYVWLHSEWHADEDKWAAEQEAKVAAISDQSRYRRLQTEKQPHSLECFLRGHKLCSQQRLSKI